jgi:hypothetical protein
VEPWGDHVDPPSKARVGELVDVARAFVFARPAR